MSPEIVAASSRPLLQVSRLLAEADLRAEERAKAAHSRFNIFTTLLRENDEVRLHTRFLHCLLDPQGLHDCGSLFLDLFLKMLSAQPDMTGEMTRWPSAGEDWSVKKETGRSEGYGQLDLLLAKGHFGIGIENKIHSGEQDRQLASYASYLESRFHSGRLLIYLTLHGSASSTHEGAPYFQMSYGEHILGWLDECLRCTYDIIPVNQLLQQYRAVIRKLTGKTMETSTMNSAAQFISANPDILRYRTQWAAAADEARMQLLDQLAEQVTRALPELQFSLHPANTESRFGEEWGGLRIRDTAGASRLPPSFEIYLENSYDDEELALGVFTNYKKIPLSEAEKIWLQKVQAAWPGDPVGVECTTVNHSTTPWPLGWLSLEAIDDASLADLLSGKANLAAAVERIAERIRGFVQALWRITDALSANPDSSPPP